MRTERVEKFFHKYCKTRDGWACTKCGRRFKGHDQHKYLMHSYIYGGNEVKGRRFVNYNALRYEPLNCLSMCKDCAYWFRTSPIDAVEWVKEYLGEEAVNYLRTHKNDMKLKHKPEHLWQIFKELRQRLEEFEDGS